MSRATTGTFLAALAMAIGVTAGCSGDEEVAVTTPGPPEPRAVQVPDLVGLGVGRAVDRLCAAGLSLGDVAVVERTPEVGRDPGAALAASRVLAMEAAAGEGAPAGTAVVLSVSVPSNAALAFRKGC